MLTALVVFVRIVANPMANVFQKQLTQRKAHPLIVIGAKRMHSSDAGWPAYLALALATGVMQLATLLAFGTLQVGYALALFQLSSLVSVGFGAHYFAEQNIRRRLVGSAVMVVGAALIVTFGRSRP